MSNVLKPLRFTKTHEWLHVQDNEVTLGITDHAQQSLGDLVFIELPEVGNNICAGDEIGVVESVKAASDVYTPVAGAIIAINHKVIEDPALVNQDPYGEGWLVKIKVTNLHQINDLLDETAYENNIAEDH